MTTHTHDFDLLLSLTVCFGIISFGVVLSYFIEWGVPTLWQTIRTLAVVVAVNSISNKRFITHII